MKILRVVAAEIGRGLVAGFAGTVAMTIASTIEMKLRRRPPSTTPAAAAGKVLGVQPRDPAGKQRFSNLVHFGYGTSWGLGRAAVGGVLCALGVRRAVAAPLAHFAAVWGAALVMLPALGVSPPPWRWGAKAIAIDAFHHGVYAAATDAAYRALGEG